MKPIVFISHMHSEKKVAIWLQEELSRIFLGAIKFFVSSDDSSIVGGDRWFTEIEEALKKAAMVLVLCSSHSVTRPWINFEAGGAWMLKKRVIPLCHAGMFPNNLPEPLKSLQSYDISKDVDLKKLVALLAKEADLHIPPNSLSSQFLPHIHDRGETELAEHTTSESLNSGKIPAELDGFTILVGPPMKLEGIDLAEVDWDSDKCFLVGRGIRERITLEPSRVGNSFIVQLAKPILMKLLGKNMMITLDLYDMDGNRWKTPPISLFENFVYLKLVKEA